MVLIQTDDITDYIINLVFDLCLFFCLNISKDLNEILHRCYVNHTDCFFKCFLFRLNCLTLPYYVGFRFPHSEFLLNTFMVSVTAERGFSGKLSFSPLLSVCFCHRREWKQVIHPGSNPSHLPLKHTCAPAQPALILTGYRNEMLCY